jgi:hypothetical protein
LERRAMMIYLDGGWNPDLSAIWHSQVRIHWIQAIIFYSMH